MSLVRRETAPVRYRDPFALARDLFAWDPFGANRPTQVFAPDFEVKETADSYVVRADLPGIKEENVDVSLHNGVLSVTGARVAEDGWQAQWAGKRIFDDGDFAISVVRGNASGPNEVDGISGASVTSYAISDMLEFWMGEHGFGPFLDRLKKGEIE